MVPLGVCVVHNADAGFSLESLLSWKDVTFSIAYVTSHCVANCYDTYSRCIKVRSCRRWCFHNICVLAIVEVKYMTCIVTSWSWSGWIPRMLTVFSPRPKDQLSIHETVAETSFLILLNIWQTMRQFSNCVLGYILIIGFHSSKAVLWELEEYVLLCV